MKWIANMQKAVRSFNRKGQYNWVKVICLGVGLAAAAVLVEKVWFEQTYDTFWADSDRIWLVNQTIVRDGELKKFSQTPGAVAFGIKHYCPQVECATKLTDWCEMKLQTPDGKTLTKNIMLADSCLTDLFSLRVLQGQAKEILSVADHCLVSRSLAEQLGGHPVGQHLTHKESGVAFQIDGIFEDIPQNSLLSGYDIILSLPSFTTREAPYDGTKNWVGNDRYRSFVRLASQTDTAQLAPGLQRMMKENLPMELLQQMQMTLGYTFTRLSDQHTHDESVKRMSWVLTILAFILIFTTVMNYLLFVMGGIPGRAKEMAIHKCYGAEHGHILGMTLSEALLHLLLSVALAAVLIGACKGTIEQLTGASVASLLCGRGAWLLPTVAAAVFLVTSLLPATLYQHIPVATAFGRYTHSHRAWKLVLLGVEFACTAFLLALLFVVSRQYTLMTNNHPGYDCDNLAHIDFNGKSSEDIARLLHELEKTPEVAHFTTASHLFILGASGNNVSLPGGNSLFNAADLYYGSRDYIATMGFDVIQGQPFTEGADSLCQVMVSRRFVEKMDSLAGWDGQAVGRSVCFTEHSSQDRPFFTICGVYDDVRIGSIANTAMEDVRPSMLFYQPKAMRNVLIRFEQLTPENMDKIRQLLRRLYPDDDLEVKPYRMLLTDVYNNERQFRSIVLIGGLIILFITLVGLIGYTNSEVARRHKEIAIRKVNGATTGDVSRLFVRDILSIALPTLIMGVAGAYWVASLWLQQFAVKASLAWWHLAVCALAVLAVILLVVLAGCLKVAKSNPVEYLKSE